MIKILIIGKKSFLGSNLYLYLSKFYETKTLSYEQSIKKEIVFFDKFSHIINTSIHPKYVKKKYNSKFALDLKFIKKFNKINFIYIYLNSRKIYFPKENINENSLISPIGNYGKNKYLTEKFLKKKLKTKLISLRISNIIGRRLNKNTRNNHKLFFDNFLKYRKYRKKIFVNNDFKDFLSIIQFCRIIKQIIKLQIWGIYNVSISQKIYVSQMVKWLDKKFFKRISFIEKQKDSFTLSNKKLIKKIKIKINKKQLQSYCMKLI